MKRVWIIGLAVCVFGALVALPVFASQICTNDPCASSEVGVFMDGISRSCGNTGDCSMDDIMQVFHNVGNYVLAIAGSLVLLMYVIGGVFILGSHGNTTWVQKGFKYLQTSTVGLIIVFVAYAGVKTLESVLRGGAVMTTGETYVTCGPGNINEGEPCGEYMRCTERGTCESECAIKENPSGMEGGWACVDTDTADPLSYAESSLILDFTSCVKELCPGDETVQCCFIEQPF